MPSGNKIIGHVGYRHLNLEIYISSKTLTQGLCGSYDNNTSNDLFDRNTTKLSVTTYGTVIDNSTAISWK